MRTKRMENIRAMYGAKRKGFSLIELVIVVSIIVVLAAILVPSLIKYTENSRAQKDVSMMDEVVNAIQLAMSDAQCFDEMLLYACDNNFITYTDSSGKYGQQIVDNEYWAPDGWGRATTITFNPEKVNGKTVYTLEKAYVNDMTYGNGSVAEQRVMSGQVIDENQCYLKDAAMTGKESGRLYNRLRQTVGDKLYNTSATYANSSYTVFIIFTQKDGVTVAEVRGAFNGTNLDSDAMASLGSGTDSYTDNDESKPEGNKGGGKTQANFSSSDLIGSGTFSSPMIEEIIKHNDKTLQDGATYKEADKYLGFDWDTWEEIYEPGKEYQVGEELPSEPKDGDIYTYGDYEYRYNMFVYMQENWNYEEEWVEMVDVWDYRYNDDEYHEYYCDADIYGLYSGSEHGWTARVIDTTKTSYGPVLTEINGKPVNGMSFTYGNCSNLTDISQIKVPITTDNVSYMFYKCASIETIPTSLKLPSFVKSMRGLFYGCSKIKTLPLTFTVPKDAQDIGYLFMHTGIKEIPVSFKLPNGIKDVSYVFYGSNIITVPGTFVLPDSTVNASYMFAECAYLTSLPNTFVIPSSVKNVSGMFRGCVELVSLPSNLSISSDITDTSYMFSDCKKLTAIPEGMCSPNNKNVSRMFYNCQSITKLPSDFRLNNATLIEECVTGCKKLEYLPENFLIKKQTIDGYELESFFQNCESLKKLPEQFTLGHLDNSDTEYVHSMSYFFAGCQSLEELPENFRLPEKMYYYSGGSVESFFSNCKSLKRIPDGVKLPDTSTVSSVFNGCVELEYIPNDFFDNFRLNSSSYMYGVFKDCKKIKTIPASFKIAEQSTYAYSLFSGCESLETLPDDFYIPKTATYTALMFENCKNLSANVTIMSSSISTYTNMFKGTTKPITLIATDTTKTCAQKLANTSSNNNVTVSTSFSSALSITNNDSDIALLTYDNNLLPGNKVTVALKSGKHIQSFTVNGTKYYGNVYTIKSTDKELVFDNVIEYLITFDIQCPDYVSQPSISSIKPGDTITLRLKWPYDYSTVSIDINGVTYPVYRNTNGYDVCTFKAPYENGTIVVSNPKKRTISIDNQCSDIVSIPQPADEVSEYTFFKLNPIDDSKKVVSFKLNGVFKEGSSFYYYDSGPTAIITDVVLKDIELLSTDTYTYKPGQLEYDDYDSYYMDWYDDSIFYVVELTYDLHEDNYISYDYDGSYLYGKGQEKHTYYCYDGYGCFGYSIYMPCTDQNYEGVTMVVKCYG